MSQEELSIIDSEHDIDLIDQSKLKILLSCLPNGQYKTWTADYGLRTTDYGLRTTDYGLRTTDYGLGIKHGLGIKRGLSITDWV